MHRSCVGQVQGIQLVLRILHGPSVAKVHIQPAFLLGSADASHDAHIAVADVCHVLRLHDLIALPKNAFPISKLRFLRGRWIQLIPQPCVERVHPRGGFGAVRREQDHIVHA